ncbi:MAG: hypothetical protein GX024_03800 [Clostridiales bacterium]|jgi:hypothetical protein|nr:hypothetical protein [Clostridiales bacterium]
MKTSRFRTTNYGVTLQASINLHVACDAKAVSAPSLMNDDSLRALNSEPRTWMTGHLTSFGTFSFQQLSSIPVFSSVLLIKGAPLNCSILFIFLIITPIILNVNYQAFLDFH